MGRRFLASLVLAIVVLAIVWHAATAPFHGMVGPMGGPYGMQPWMMAWGGGITSGLEAPCGSGMVSWGWRWRGPPPDLNLSANDVRS